MSAVGAMASSYNTARINDEEFRIQVANQRQTELAAQAAKLAEQKHLDAQRLEAVHQQEKALEAAKIKAAIQKKEAETAEAARKAKEEADKKRKLNYLG